jgi:lysozyme family protein
MAANSWPATLAFVWRPENDGQALHTDANDSGGATNMGVTHGTWVEAVAHGLVRSVGLADGTRDELATVLRVMFWKPIYGDQLPAGVDMAVFNLAMVAGIGRAARVLQQSVGVTQDGDIGPMTMRAVWKMAPKTLIGVFTSAEESFYAQIPSAKFFLRGWDRRADDCKVAAISLSAGGQ